MLNRLMWSPDASREQKGKTKQETHELARQGEKTCDACRSVVNKSFGRLLRARHTSRERDCVCECVEKCKADDCGMRDGERRKEEAGEVGEKWLDDDRSVSK